MQGIFHTGMSVIRGQMRLAGVVAPADAGVAVDRDTGELLTPAEAGGAEVDSEGGAPQRVRRKRARMDAMALLQCGQQAQPQQQQQQQRRRRRELNPTHGGAPPLLVGQEQVFLGADNGEQVVGVGGEGDDPNAEGISAAPHPPGDEAFWGEYKRMSKLVKDVLTWGDESRPDSDNDEMLKDARDTAKARVGGGAVISSISRIDELLMDYVNELACQADGNYKKAYISTMGTAHRSLDRPATGLRIGRGNVMLDVMEWAKGTLNSKMTIMGGNFVLGGTALHMARWKGIFAMDELNLYKLADILSANYDIIVHVHLDVLLKIITSGSDDAEKAKCILGLYIMIVEYEKNRMKQQVFGGRNDNDSRRIVIGGIIRSRLANIRTWALNRETTYTGINEDNIVAFRQFMDPSFAVWMNDLYTQLSTFTISDDTGVELKIKEAWANEYRHKMYPDEHEFVDDVMDVIHVDVIRLLGYGEDVRAKAINSGEGLDGRLRREAQQLDYYYAGLVRGASVRMSMDRVWTSGEPPVPALMDSKKFFDVVWAVVNKLMPPWALRGRMRAMQREPTSEAAGRQMISITQHMKDVRNAMVEVWTDSSSFRVSDTVHMIEVQVLQRLKRDGLIPWFDSPCGGTELSTLEVCNWFRRDRRVRDQFAMTVGKRMDSEALISTQNAGIMSHQRAVNWSEREYMALHQKVQELGGVILSACMITGEEGLQEARRKSLYLDYLDLGGTNMQRRAGEEALYAVARSRPPRR